MKNIFKFNHISLLITVAASSLIAGCGGGGGGSGGPVSQTARFIDDPVYGLTYNCGSGSATTTGSTSPTGQFNYFAGQSCTFSIGNVTLGPPVSPASDGVVTPQDVAGVPRSDTAAPSAQAIAQFLQSLDSGSTSGQITIPSTVITQLSSASVTPVSIVSSSGSVSQTLLQTLVTSAGVSTLVSQAQAKSKLDTQINIGAVSTSNGSVSASSPAVLNSIAVSSNVSSNAAGLTEQFTATGYYSDGSTNDLTSASTWSSSNTSSVTVSSAGVGTGVAQGTSTITAGYTPSGSTTPVTGTFVQTTLPAVLQSITVTSNVGSNAAGLTEQFAATGTYSDGSTNDLTSASTWSSSNTSSVTVSSTGVGTGVAQGTSTITASYTPSGSTTPVTGTFLQTTTAPTFLNFAISWASATISSIQSGLTAGLKAVETLTDNTTKDISSLVTWLVNPTGGGSISNSIFTAGSPGSDSISASIQGTNSNNTLSFVVTPGTVSASDGAAMSYAAINFVSLIDNTKISLTADVNGAVSVPSSGLTLPALVKATSLDGTKINYGLLSASNQTTVPVNPLSTLVLTIAAGADPSSITSVSQITQQSLQSANSSVNSIFQTVFSKLGVSNSVNLLTTSFSTNHTGLDLVLDSMSVIFDASGNPTLCTKISNSCKILNLGNLDTTPINITQQQLALINSVPLVACSQFINALSSNSFSSYTSSLFDAGFLNSGLNAQQYSSAMSNKLGSINATFNTPIYLGQDANNNYLFQFYVFNNTLKEYAGTQTMQFKLNGSNCVMAGDQLPFSFKVTSQITYYTRVSGSFGGVSNPAAVSSVVTSTPISGIYFNVGGDGFGDSNALDVVNSNGSAVTIQTVKFYFCDSNNNCNNHLIDLTKGYTNNGFYYTPNGVNSLPLVDYASVGITSAASFYNGNANPIQVQMFDGNNNLIQTSYLKLKGGFVSQNDLQAINLPSVTNAQTILNTQVDLQNPQLNINIPSGTLVQSASLTNGPSNGTPTTTNMFVLSSSSLNLTINKTISASNDSYRSIMLNGSTTNGKPISVKYVFSNASGSI
jgi:hypothetical protein